MDLEKVVFAKGSLDHLVGKTEEETVKAVTEAGGVTRLVFKDGNYLMGTCDYRVDRANLSVTNGIVTAIDIG